MATIIFNDVAENFTIPFQHIAEATIFGIDAISQYWRVCCFWARNRLPAAAYFLSENAMTSPELQLEEELPSAPAPTAIIWRVVRNQV